MRFSEMLSSFGEDLQQLRGRIVRRAKLAGGDDPPSVTPGEDTECECGHCVQGVTIPDADPLTGCCESHLRWEMKNPWKGAGEPELFFEYIGGGSYLTQSFDGPPGDTNEYRYQLDVDVADRSSITLLRETDAGGPDICVVYRRDSFDCQCDNEFEIRKPYGQWSGVDRDDFHCRACIRPVVDLATSCASANVDFVPAAYRISGLGSGCGPFQNSVVVIHWESAYPPLGAIGDFQNCLNFAPARNDCFFYSLLSDDSAPYVNRVIGLEGRAGSVGSRWHVRLRGARYAGDPATITCDDLQTWQSEVDFDPLVGGTFTTVSGDCSHSIQVTPLIDISPPQSTGACDDDCMPTNTPPDPDNGGCCYRGVCYERVSQSLCGSLGGLWQSGGCTDCEAKFACCLPGGSCSDLNFFECALLGGTSVAGVRCEDDPCEKGACCRASNGGCDEVTESECGVPDYFLGTGTTCSTSPCDDVGSCCHNNNAGSICSANCECWLLTEAECDALDVSGTSNYAGDGTYCDGPGAVDCDCRGLVCDFL